MFGKRIEKIQVQLEDLIAENTALRNQNSKMAQDIARLKMENSTLLQNIRVLKQYENLFNYDGTQQKNNLDGGGD